MKSKVLQRALSIVVLVLCFFFLRKLSQEYSYNDIVTELHQLTFRQVGWGFFFCALNYFVLTLYDSLAFIYINKALQFWRIALTAFVSYTFSHNLGFAALSGGALRFRLYSRWGLSPKEVGEIIAFSGVHFWLGLCVLVGGACLIDQNLFQNIAQASRFGPAAALIVGLLPLLYIGVCWKLGGRAVLIRGWTFRIPRLSLIFKALGVAIADWIFAAAVFWSVLPHHEGISFLQVLTYFFVAQIVAVVTHVPGGLGVFETLMLYFLGRTLPHNSILGALLVFRIIYYLIPFSLGVGTLVAYELKRRQERKLLDRLRPVEGVLSSVVPPALGVGLFVGGLILLFSGSTPTASDRWWWVDNVVPLLIVETSHFINSLIGVGFLILAWGIRKRLLSAYQLTLLFLFGGIIASLTKGFDYEEATYLSLLFVAFAFTKRYFYRKSSLFMGLGWYPLVFAAAGVMCAAWLGFFSFEHVEYQHHLWWEFTFEGDAPRFLRGMVGATVLLTWISIRVMMLPAKPEREVVSTQEMQKAKEILNKSPVTTANLVFLGDKQILLSEDERAFLMYRIQGQSWICMGDPVGEEQAKQELIWKFRELSDHHDGLCVFYQVSARDMPYYLDVGLKLFKLGEEAIVSLDSFSLEGTKAKAFRNTLNRFEREGYSFEVVSVENTPALFPELQEVSKEWLKEKNTREKGFSLGYFDKGYLSHFPMALVRKEGQILAFANIWSTALCQELSVDLMRHRQGISNGIMDFLFLHLMRWGKMEGYTSFNLGMSPLSGFTHHRLAPFWNKVGSYLYKHGEHFYNFEGLRRYKEKYHPVWQPRYIASPGGLAWPIVMANVSSLISGGLKGVIFK